MSAVTIHFLPQKTIGRELRRVRGRSWSVVVGRCPVLLSHLIRDLTRAIDRLPIHIGQQQQRRIIMVEWLTVREN